ncbi:MAG: DDE-type integrase/transposase/recombinase [Nitrosopumilus sp.]|nr:DDE-type integrase/transposase/recombinase [Nitrosopumilus sp.]
MANCSARFIKNYADITAPLRSLTRKANPFKWEETEQLAFENLKQLLVNAETLAYYIPGAPTKIIVDASKEGAGVILSQQQPDGDYRVVEYASKAFTPTESRYSQTEREALAVLYGCTHFHYYVYDRVFDIETDHKSLVKILSNKSKPPLRIERWLLKLQSYKYNLHFKPGKYNPADFLSRNPYLAFCATDSEEAERYVNFVTDHAIPKSVTLTQIQEETKRDVLLIQLKQCIRTGNWTHQEEINHFEKQKNYLSIANDIILMKNRIVIPKVLRLDILKIAHKSHQGIVKTKAMLREKVYWPNINKDVEVLIGSCYACQVVTQAPSKCEPLRMSEIPKSAWHTLAIDIQGPYPTGDFLLVIIDYRSRYPVVCQLKNITTKSITKALRKVFMTFGYPYRITTDNGSNFKSSAFCSYLQAHGIKHRIVTPYWPSANGEVERFNRVLKKQNQTAHVEGLDWREKLQEFLLYYRSTPHTVTGEAPATVLFGRGIRNGLPQVESDVSEDVEVDKTDRDNKEKAKVYADKKRRARDAILKTGDLVLLKNLHKLNKLSTEYEHKPYRVINVYPRSCKIENAKGQYIRSKAHLKPFQSSENTHTLNQRLSTEALTTTTCGGNIINNKSKSSITNNKGKSNVKNNLNVNIYSDNLIGVRADLNNNVTPARIHQGIIPVAATPVVVAAEALAAPANIVPEAAVEANYIPADVQAVVPEEAAAPRPEEDAEMENLRVSLGGLEIADAASRFVNQRRNRQRPVEGFLLDERVGLSSHVSA